MEPELAFPVEKTLVEAGPAWVFRTRALKMTEYNTAEIRPTPAARFRFRFVQIELLVTSIVTVAVFPVIVLKYRPTAPRGILFGAMAALLLLDLAVFLIFTRVRGKPLPSEPIRIDLGRRIVFIPRLAIGSRLALAFGNGTSEPREVRLGNVAPLQICAGSLWNYVPFKAFQLNLLLGNPAGERIPLMTHGAEKELREDAASLARFLNLPLLDHSSE